MELLLLARPARKTPYKRTFSAIGHFVDVSYHSCISQLVFGTVFVELRSNVVEQSRTVTFVCAQVGLWKT
jgi:hypothetical protein